MPNRKEHDMFGAITGGGVAFFCSREQKLLQQIIETFGGVLGGQIGSRIPDIVDPATSPNHRAIGHAVVPAVAAMSWYLENVGDWQDAFRNRSRQFMDEANRSDKFLETVVNMVIAIFFGLAAGATVGFAAGHVSHLEQVRFKPGHTRQL
jgi:hypothetical protein